MTNILIQLEIRSVEDVWQEAVTRNSYDHIPQPQPRKLPASSCWATISRKRDGGLIHKGSNNPASVAEVKQMGYLKLSNQMSQAQQAQRKGPIMPLTHKEGVKHTKHPKRFYIRRCLSLDPHTKSELHFPFFTSSTLPQDSLNSGREQMAVTAMK